MAPMLLLNENGGDEKAAQTSRWVVIPSVITSRGPVKASMTEVGRRATVGSLALGNGARVLASSTGPSRAKALASRYCSFHSGRDDAGSSTELSLAWKPLRLPQPGVALRNLDRKSV